MTKARPTHTSQILHNPSASRVPPQSSQHARHPESDTGDSRDTRRLVAFVGLTYLLTFWIVPLKLGGFPVFPYGPDAALFIVVAFTSGRSGIRRLLSSLRQWRTNPGWYAFAVLAPVAIATAATVGARLLGAPAAALPGPDSAVEFAVILPVMILVGGALGEELGWRGFALPVLQRRLAPLTTVLTIFLLHAVWHLPLFLADDPPPAVPFLLELAAGGVVLAWLMNCTGRIWLPILLHGAHNMSQQAFMSGFTGQHAVTVQWLTAIGWALLALIVIAATRAKLVSAERRPLTTALHETEPRRGN